MRDQKPPQRPLNPILRLAYIVANADTVPSAIYLYMKNGNKKNLGGKYLPSLPWTETNMPKGPGYQLRRVGVRQNGVQYGSE